MRGHSWSGISKSTAVVIAVAILVVVAGLYFFIVGPAGRQPRSEINLEITREGCSVEPSVVRKGDDVRLVIANRTEEEHDILIVKDREVAERLVENPPEEEEEEEVLGEVAAFDFLIEVEGGGLAVTRFKPDEVGTFWFVCLEFEADELESLDAVIKELSVEE